MLLGGGGGGGGGRAWREQCAPLHAHGVRRRRKPAVAEGGLTAVNMVSSRGGKGGKGLGGCSVARIAPRLRLTNAKLARSSKRPAGAAALRCSRRSVAAVSSVMRVRPPTMITDSLDALGSGGGASDASRLQREGGGAEAGCTARAFGAGAGFGAACRLSTERACSCRCACAARAVASVACCCSVDTRPESSQTRPASSSFSCCSPADEATQWCMSRPASRLW